jgi:hypothetical protein
MEKRGNVPDGERLSVGSREWEGGSSTLVILTPLCLRRRYAGGVAKRKAHAARTRSRLKSV